MKNYDVMLNLLTSCLEQDKKDGDILVWFYEHEDEILRVVGEASKATVATGEEIKEFYDDGKWWGDSWYIEQEDGLQLVDDRGTWLLASEEHCDLSSIDDLVWQGAAEPPQGYDYWAFADAFTQWKEEKC